MRWQVTVGTAAIVATGCASKPSGIQLAEFDPHPTQLVARGDTLVLEVQDGDADTTGPLSAILAVPRTGGAARIVAQLGAGDLVVVGDRLIHVATYGPVSVVQLATGGAHQLYAPARHPGRVSQYAPIAVAGGIVLMSQRSDEPTSIAQRIDLTGGSPTALFTFDEFVSGMASGRDPLGGYMASQLSGATFRVSPDGKVDRVDAPPGDIGCVALTSTHVWWFQSAMPPAVDLRGVPLPLSPGEQWLQQLRSRLVTVYAAPRSGGAPTKLRTIDSGGPGWGIPCIGAGDEVVYGVDGRVSALSFTGEPREIIETTATVEQLAVEDGTVYWTQRVAGRWSLRAAPLR